MKTDLICLLLVLGCSLLGCSLFDPAGTALNEAEALYEKGEAEAAAQAFEAVVREHPDTEAAGTAALRVHHARIAQADMVGPEEALQLTVGVVSEGTGSAKALARQQLPGRYKAVVDSLGGAERYWEAGQIAAEATRQPDVAAAISSSIDALGEEPQFALSLRWANSEESDPVERIALALEILALEGAGGEAVRPYLGSNVSTVLGPRCTGDLKAVTSLEELSALQGSCETIITHDGESATGQEAKKVLEQIPGREAAIKSSPSYKTDAALQECRAFKSWVKRQRRAGNITALQQGVQGARGQRYQRAMEYLQGRMFSLSSQDAQYRFARRVRNACGD